MRYQGHKLLFHRNLIYSTNSKVISSETHPRKTADANWCFHWMVRTLPSCGITFEKVDFRTADLLKYFLCFETIYRCLRFRVKRGSGCVQGALSCLACFFACVFTRKGWREVRRQTEFKQTLDHGPSVFIHNKNGSTENACKHSDYSHEPC